MRLYDLFKRNHAPEEREILNAMEEFRLGFQEASPYDVIALQDCFVRIQDMLDAKENLPAKMMRERGLWPLEVVYLICIQWSKRQIASGQHHFHRGVLTAGGKGYVRVFDSCVSGLVAAERMNTERAGTEIARLHAAIRDAG